MNTPNALWDAAAAMTAGIRLKLCIYMPLIDARSSYASRGWKMVKDSAGDEAQTSRSIRWPRLLSISASICQINDGSTSIDRGAEGKPKAELQQSTGDEGGADGATR